MFVCFIPPLIFIGVIVLSILTLSRFLKSYFSCFLVLIVFQLIQLAQFDILNISLILCCSFLFTSSAFLTQFSFFSIITLIFVFFLTNAAICVSAVIKFLSPVCHSSTSTCHVIFDCSVSHTILVFCSFCSMYLFI